MVLQAGNVHSGAFDPVSNWSTTTADDVAKSLAALRRAAAAAGP